MFDVGFSELLVIGIVALVVIGPERLPKVARTVGALLGRAQRYFADVKSEVNRELQLEELRRLQNEMAAQAEKVDQDVRQAGSQAVADVSSLEGALKQSLAETESLPPPPQETNPKT